MTLAFYECEEVADRFNGLRRIFAEQPALLAGDFAVLLEPTDGWVEAGCQGVIVLEAQFDGERAHTARPWMGRNAIHRAADVLGRLAAHESDTVVVDGLEYRESLQVVRIEGGIAGKHNVVPDACTRRGRPPVRAVLHRGRGGGAGARRCSRAPTGRGAAVAAGARRRTSPTRWSPSSSTASACRCARSSAGPTWRGSRHAAIPAVNFGPGDPEIAHTAGEL